MGKGLLGRDGALTKAACVFFSFVLAFGMTPVSAFAQPTQGGDDQGFAQVQDVQQAPADQAVEAEKPAQEQTPAAPSNEALPEVESVATPEEPDTSVANANAPNSGSSFEASEAPDPSKNIDKDLACNSQPIPSGIPTTNSNGEAVAYLTISDDGKIVVSDGDISGVAMANLEVPIAEAAKINLDEYGLGKYKYDADDDGVYETTVLQLYIYAVENYYAGGVTGEKITPNGTYVGLLAADQAPGSFYMTNFWGHDENLTYYCNGEYPLQYTGWGATADRIILRPGMHVDVTMFSNWGFHSDRAAGHTYFYDTARSISRDAMTVQYKATVGTPVELGVMRAGANMGAEDGGTGAYDTSYVAVADRAVYYGTSVDPTSSETLGSTDANGKLNATFTEPGTYYVWVDGGLGVNDGTTDSYVSGAAVAKVIVADQQTPDGPAAPALVLPEDVSADGVTLPQAIAGAEYNLELPITGNPAPVVTVTGLPKGLYYDATHSSIRGTTLATGTFDVTVTMDNGIAPATTGGFSPSDDSTAVVKTFKLTVAEDFAGSDLIVYNMTDGTKLTVNTLKAWKDTDYDNTAVYEVRIPKLKTLKFVENPDVFKYMSSYSYLQTRAVDIDGSEVFASADVNAHEFVMDGESQVNMAMAVSDYSDTFGIADKLMRGHDNALLLRVQGLTGTEDTADAIGQYYIIVDIDSNDNQNPVLSDGYSDYEKKTITLGETFSVDLNDVYTDPDGDKLHFTCDLGNKTTDCDAQYSFTPDAVGKYELWFYPHDDADGYFDDPYHVSLTVEEPAVANAAPTLAEGVEAEAEAAAEVGGTYAVDLTKVFADADGDALTYTVAVDGAEAVAADASYSYAAEKAGYHTLVFTASDGKDASPAYTVKLTVGTPSAMPTRAEGVSATASALVDEGATYELDLTKIFADVDTETLTYEVAINGAAPVAAVANYSYAGANGKYTLVFTANDGFSTSTDTYTVNLTVGDVFDGDIIVYNATDGTKLDVTKMYGWPKNDSDVENDRQAVYKVTVPTAKDLVVKENPSTMMLDSYYTKHDRYIDRVDTTDAYDGVTIFKGSQNALKYTVSADALRNRTHPASFYNGMDAWRWSGSASANIIPLMALGATTPACDELGAQSFYWLVVEIQDDSNKAPVLAEGVEAAVEASVAVGGTYELDLTKVFADPENDALTYKVSIDGAAPVAADAAYTFAPEGETTTLAFTANDGIGNSADTYTVTLTAKAVMLEFETTELAAATVGAAYEGGLTLAGVAEDDAPSVYVVGGFDIPGLAIDKTGAITGTPTKAGTYTFNAIAADSTRNTGLKTITLTVNDALAIDTAALDGGVVGKAYEAKLAATATDDVAWSLAEGSALPEGLSLAEDGTISGTPAAAGTTSFTAVATTPAGTKASKEFSITVKDEFQKLSGTIYLTVSKDGEWAKGTDEAATTLAYVPVDLAEVSAADLAAAGMADDKVAAAEDAPYLYETNLAKLLAFAKAEYGVDAGTNAAIAVNAKAADAKAAIAAGDFVDIALYTDADAFAGDLYFADAEGAIVHAFAAAETGKAFDAKVVLASGEEPAAAAGKVVEWGRELGVAEGRATTGEDGIAAITANEAGTYFAWAKDAAGEALPAYATFAVTGDEVAAAPEITTTELPMGFVGEEYAGQIEAFGTPSEFTYAVLAGSLPAGLTLSESGAITGTPKQAGTFMVTVRAINEGGLSDEAELQLVVKEHAQLTGLLIHTGWSPNNSTVVLRNASDSYTTDNVFDAATYEYTLPAQGDSSTQLRFRPQAADGATVTLYWGEDYSQSKVVTWTKGSSNWANCVVEDGVNTIKFVVTPPAGSDLVESTYLVHVPVVPSITGLSVSAGGKELYLDKNFSATTFEYTVDVPADAAAIDFATTPRHATYDVTYNGSASPSVDITDADKVDVVVTGGEGENARSETYTVNINKVAVASATFAVTPADAIVSVYDAKNAKVEPAADGSYKGMFANGGYTYTVSKTGYKAATGTVPAEGGVIEVVLEEAPASTLTDVDAYWPTFRGSDNNMAITNVAMPTDPENTSLLWSKRFGSGWGNVPGLALIIDDSVVVCAGKGIYKVDRQTGDIKSSGDLVGSGNWGYTPLTYANGMIFVPISGGIQAFNAETLESLWVYKDKLGGQSLSQIVYSNGYVYTGWWNSETKDANYACVSVTDEDPTQATEEKVATWTHTHAGGFYWAGGVALGDYIVVGSDDGTSGTEGDSVLYAFNGKTGEIASSIVMEGFGDQRSSMAWDASRSRVYFTSKGGNVASAAFDATTGQLSDLKWSSTGWQCTGTPIVYDGVVYVGFGAGFGAGSGRFGAFDANTMEKLYEKNLQGYPQASMVLSTAYKDSGYLYFYTTYNTTPGGLQMVKVPVGARTGDDAEVIDIYDAAGFSQYCICSPIVGPDGTIYYKNDSGALLAVATTRVAPTITTEALEPAAQGKAYEAELAATGAPAEFTWALAEGSELPEGMELSEDGVLSGTPAISDAYTFTVTATNLGGTAEKEFELVVTGTPTIAVEDLADAVVFTEYEAQLKAKGQPSELTWFVADASKMPAGLTLSKTGVLSGTPTEMGEFTFDVMAKNANGVSAPAAVTVRVTGEAPVVTTTELPAATVGVAYEGAIAVEASPAASVEVKGLPEGLAFDAEKQAIVGTAQQSGLFELEVTATNGVGEPASAQLALAVNGAPTIVTTTLAQGVEGREYSQVIEAQGYPEPQIWISGTDNLPEGLVAENGAITGTPAETGTFTVTAMATNEFGASDEVEVTLVIITADQAAANEVEAIIEALPEAADVTDADKAAVDAAREALDALTDAQEALVSDEAKAKLIADEEALMRIKLYPVNEELMFKVVNAYIQPHKDGSAELVFSLSGTGYKYVYNGTVDEALASTDAIAAAYAGNATSGKLVWGERVSVDQSYATDRPADTPSYQEHSDGVASKLTFAMPLSGEALAAVTAGTGSVKLPFVSVSDTRAKNAIKGTTPWANALLARQAIVDLDAGTVRTGNLKETLAASVESSIETMAVEAAGELYTFGTPAANEYVVQPTFTLSDGNATYDAAFIGTAEQAAAATKGVIEIGEDGVVTIPFHNVLGATPQVNVNTWEAKAAFRVAEGADFAEAGTWVERTITVNPEAATIAIAGAELTAMPADGTYKIARLADDGFGMPGIGDTGNALVEPYVVVKDGEAYLVFATGSGRFDGFAWGTYDEVVDPADKTKLVEGAESAAGDPVYGEGKDVLDEPTKNNVDGYRFTMPLTRADLAKLALGQDVTKNYVVKYYEGYSASHNGDWYKPSSAVPAVTFGGMEALDESTDLPEAKADYAAVRTALKTVPADLEPYTADSAKAVTDAVAAVDTTKKASDQAAVDAMAKAISDAVAALAIDEDKAAAKAVEDQIAALPAADEVTTADEAAIEAAAKALDELTDAQEALVSDEAKAKLAEDQAALEAAKQAEADAAAAKAVEDAIAALPAAEDVTTADEAAINAAAEALEALTDAQEALVSDEAKAKLAADQEALAAVKQAEADAAAAKAVEDAIAALPAAEDVTAEDADAINAAAAALEALTDAQEALVSDEAKAKLAADQKALQDLLSQATIKRIAGENYANETAAAISAEAFESSEWVVIARDDDFADALGAVGLAGTLNAPIILTDRTELSAAAAAEVTRLGAKHAYIIGGTGAIRTAVDDGLAALGVTVEPRIWGDYSWDTSLACAQKIVELGGEPGKAIVAMSINFQDALSMSPYAYKYKVPIVLQTAGDTAADRGFTPEAQQWLAGRQVTVAGGPGAISDASLSGLTAERIFGESGYDTSQKIADYMVEKGFLSADAVVLACGAQAPKGVDALAGAALAGKLSAPILLVNSNEAMEAADLTTVDGFVTSHKADIKQAYVLGGAYVAPQDLYDQVKTLIDAEDLSA